MATHRRINTMPPVESISGKFARVKDTVSNFKASQLGFKWLGGMVRNGDYTTNMVFRRKALPDPNALQRAQMQRFTDAQGYVKRAWADVDIMATVSVKWQKQTTVHGVSPRNYTTVRGWMFGVYMSYLVAGEEIPTNPFA